MGAVEVTTGDTGWAGGKVTAGDGPGDGGTDAGGAGAGGVGAGGAGELGG